MPVVIFGLLSLSLGLWGLAVWWWEVVEVLRGVAPIALLLLGVVALAAGVSQVRKSNTSDEDLFGDEG